MKRLVMALMALVFLMSTALVLPACAETVIRNGIEVTLMTDKESYDSMDAINASLTITNTNGYAVQNVSSEITAPDGYMLSGNAEEEHGTLRAGQSQTQEAALHQADYVPNLPKTGDNSHGMLWGLLFVLSSVVLCAMVIRNPQAKRFFSLLLCLVMISTMVLEAVPVAAESAHETEIIIVSKVVLVNGKEVLLTGTVTYEADVQTAQNAAGPTISGEKINDTAEYVKVREGDTLSFAGKIKASEGAVISSVQVFVYDAETEVPYSMGEKYYTAAGVNAAEFDLSVIPEMTIGDAFGPSGYALTEGKRYAVMFYATDSNGNGFADMDAQVAGNQGPVISVRVLLPVDKCDHSAKEYTYERDEYTAPRITDNGDGLTHLIEASYKRYCADCGAYLMNIWGSAVSQEHTMADGECTGCGYSAVPMLFAAQRSLEEISFESYPLGVLAGQSYYISWDENGGSDTYIVNVKLLDGEPAYHDEEAGTSIVLNSKRSWNYVWFTVPKTARIGQYVKVHVYGESDGIQTEAGNQLYLRVGCEHVNSVAETVEKYYPIEGDETHHQCIEYYTHECLECGLVLEKRESDPVISEHEFNSIGRCSLCRYEKELDCYHTYSNRTLLRSYYQQSNDSQHYLVNIYRVNCRDCGVLIYSSMPEYQLQNHEFNAAGECVQCNWNEDSECQHDNVECTQFGEVTYSCETLNGGELPFYHWVEQECVLICADCGEVLVEDWSTSDVEPHDFDSNNTCLKCGYVDEYLIEDSTAPQILSFTSSVGTTVKIGEMPTYRAVVYDENLRYAELYTDDGWTLDMVTNPVSSTVDLSAWSYAGEAGTYTYKVMAVDYAGNSAVQELTITIVAEDTGCRHTTYTDVYNPNIPIQYTDNKDGKTHIWQNGYDRICNTCHEKIGVVYGKENTADHDYSNGDVCPCGYDRSNCQHTPCKIKTYNRHLFAPLNEKQHQTIAIVWDMVCSTCGKTYEEIDYVGDENNPVGLPYDHVWKDGKCIVEGCGYGCVHEFQDMYLENGNHKAENAVWESKGESGHWCTSIEYWEKCVNCGLEQKYTKLMPYGEEVQSHMLQVTKVHYDYNDEEHWIHGVTKKCSGIGCDYTVFEESTNSVHEAHIDINDRCIICGAKRIEHISESNSSEENRPKEEYTSPADVINGPLFSQESNYQFEVFQDYVNANGGSGLYSSIVIDTVLNIGDILKMEDVDLTLAKSIRSIQLMVEGMEDEYYVEQIENASPFIRDLLEFMFENEQLNEDFTTIKNGNKFFKTLTNILDKTLGKRWMFGWNFQNSQIERYEQLLETLGEISYEDQQILIISYNEAYNTKIKYGELIQGLGAWKDFFSTIGRITKAIEITEDVYSLTKDYAVEMAKVSVVRDALEYTSEQSLQEAAAYVEEYYSNFYVRVLEQSAEWLQQYAEAGSSVWSGVKLAFQLSPGDVDNISSACIALVTLQEVVAAFERDVEGCLRDLENGKKSVSSEDLKKKIHALIDAKQLTAELAKELTWSNSKQERLNNNIDAMENWHSEVDALVDSWY